MTPCAPVPMKSSRLFLVHIMRVLLLHVQHTHAASPEHSMHILHLAPTAHGCSHIMCRQCACICASLRLDLMRSHCLFTGPCTAHDAAVWTLASHSRPPSQLPSHHTVCIVLTFISDFISSLSLHPSLLALLTLPSHPTRSYSKLRHFAVTFREGLHAKKDGVAPAASSGSTKNKEIGILSSLLVAAVAGAGNQLLTMPASVVATRMQVRCP